MTVYIVIETVDIYYSVTHIIGIFSRRETAESYIRECGIAWDDFWNSDVCPQQPCCTSSPLHIEEFEVDMTHPLLHAEGVRRSQ